MMTKPIGSLILLLLSGSLFILCGQVDVQSHINRYEIGHRDLLVYQLTIQGVPNPSQPNLTFMPSFNVIKTFHHSQVITRSGRNILHSYFLYVLSPRETGLVSIPSFTINQMDRDFHTQSFILKVRKDVPRIHRSAEKTFKIEATVSKKNVFLNEQIQFAVTLHTGKRLKSAQMLSSESFPGFWQEWFPTSGKMNLKKGANTMKRTVMRGALFPNRTGRITIRPLRFMIETNARSLQDRIRILSTNPITINVKKLPGEAAGLPVGKFSIRLSVNTQRIDINSVLPVTVNITGNGNLKTVTVPDIAGSNIFSSSITNVERRYRYNHHLSGWIRSQSMITFKSPGPTVIPSVILRYFNPDTGRISTASTPSRQIFVSGERSIPDETMSVPETQVLRKGKDIDFILSGAIHRTSAPLFQKRSFRLFLIIPFAVSMIWFIKRLIWKFIVTEKLVHYRNDGFRTIMKGLKETKTYEDLYDLIRNYVVHKIEPGEFQNMMDAFLSNIPPSSRNDPDIQDFIAMWNHARQIKFSPAGSEQSLSRKDIDHLRKMMKKINGLL